MEYVLIQWSLSSLLSYCPTFYSYPTIRYVLNGILKSVEYALFNMSSLEDDINLTVRVDHPKGVGIVLGQYVLHSSNKRIT